MKLELGTKIAKNNVWDCPGRLCTIYGLLSRLPWLNYMKGRNRHKAISELGDTMTLRLRVLVLFIISRWNMHQKHKGNYGDTLSDDLSSCCSNLRIKTMLHITIYAHKSYGPKVSKATTVKIKQELSPSCFSILSLCEASEDRVHYRASEEVADCPLTSACQWDGTIAPHTVLIRGHSEKLTTECEPQLCF